VIQPVSVHDVFQPVRRAVGQPVLLGQFAKFGQLVQDPVGRIIRVFDEQFP